MMKKEILPFGLKYILFISICTSCAVTPHFSPSYQPFPLYHKQKDIHIDGAIAPNLKFYQVTQMPWNIDGYFGYSLTNHLFIDFRTTFNKIDVNNNVNDINKWGDDKYNIARLNMGFGFGYYKWANNFVFGIKTGLLFGKTNLEANQYMNFYDNSYPINTYFNKYFSAKNFVTYLCPFIGYENEYTQLDIQLNCLRERVFNIDNNLTGLYYENEIENIKPFGLISKPYTDWAIEPSITLKGGLKNIKFVIQKVFSNRYSQSNILYMKDNIYFGVELNFNIDDIFTSKNSYTNSIRSTGITSSPLYFRNNWTIAKTSFLQYFEILSISWSL